MSDKDRLANTQSQSRGEVYASKYSSRFWLEEAATDNPYVCAEAYLHGYNFLELVKHKSLAEILYLLFQGELPKPDKLALFESACAVMLNPGSRHPAARSAVQAAVGGTISLHVLPIALSVFGGETNSSGAVEPAMKFMVKNSRKPVEGVFDEISISLSRESALDASETSDPWAAIAPGFGQLYASPDSFASSCARILLENTADTSTIEWALDLDSHLHKLDASLLRPGMAAAVFLDLGFNARTGALLYQLFSAPGLLAHGMEYMGKPITSVPFPSDDDYFIERHDA